MKSIIPGMDPFLEGHLWPDVHSSLAGAIKELLTPLLAPKYVARLETYTVNDTTPEVEIGITYPDIAVLMRQTKAKEPALAYGNTPAISVPTVTIPTNTSITVRIPVVEIRDTAHNRLITVIEILSLVNKKSPGLEAYREKRIRIQRSGVHLLEIDLLRRGVRPLTHPMLPLSDYAMLLSRAGSQNTEAWTLNLRDLLPVLPVPLAEPDEDIPLDLKKALDIIYERSMYQLSIDYQKAPPPPTLSEADRLWMTELLSAN